jgi:hypothetical protein
MAVSKRSEKQLQQFSPDDVGKNSRKRKKKQGRRERKKERKRI